jgi:hypothetical protein
MYREDIKWPKYVSHRFRRLGLSIERMVLGIFLAPRNPSIAFALHFVRFCRQIGEEVC